MSGCVLDCRKGNAVGTYIRTYPAMLLEGELWLQTVLEWRRFSRIGIQN